MYKFFLSFVRMAGRKPFHWCSCAVLFVCTGELATASYVWACLVLSAFKGYRQARNVNCIRKEHKYFARKGKRVAAINGARANKAGLGAVSRK